MFVSILLRDLACDFRIEFKSLRDHAIIEINSPMVKKTTRSHLKVSVYPKFDHFSKKMFFAFSDRSYCNLSFKKNSMKKDGF